MLAGARHAIEKVIQKTFLGSHISVTEFGEGLANSDLQEEERNCSLVVVDLQYIMGMWAKSLTCKE